jgi:hypothetical protein
MTRRFVPLLVLVAAFAALAGTISYAVARATDGGNQPYGSMMGGSGYTMMSAGGNRMAWYVNGSGPVGSIAEARARAQTFADRLGLKVAEVIQFSGNFYVRLDESAGKPATEVLVDPQTGAVTLEYGPAMMWNTRYGMMRGTSTTGYGGMMGSGSGSGMMGGWSGYGGMMGSSGSGMMSGMMGRYGTTPTSTPSGISGPVDLSEAHRLAQRWLNTNVQGITVESGGDSFPGYYTMETLKNGKIAGMISVNKSTGAVWYHWWHGRFVAISE